MFFIFYISHYFSKQRTCKAGAGREKDPGLANTPGFQEQTSYTLSEDHRGAMKLRLPRNNNRINQSSTDMLQSWRANCDVQLLIYDCDPLQPSINDIARVTDYIVGYACKGNATTSEEKEQIKHMIKT